jgi:hypothetical protein
MVQPHREPTPPAVLPHRCGQREGLAPLAPVAEATRAVLPVHDTGVARVLPAPGPPMDEPRLPPLPLPATRSTRPCLALFCPGPEAHPCGPRRWERAARPGPRWGGVGSRRPTTSHQADAEPGEAAVPSAGRGPGRRRATVSLAPVTRRAVERPPPACGHMWCELASSRSPRASKFRGSPPP